MSWGECDGDNQADLCDSGTSRSLDYSTLCKFRTRFRKPLKDLFRQVVKLGMRMGLVTLLEVAETTN